MRSPLSSPAAIVTVCGLLFILMISNSALADAEQKPGQLHPLSVHTPETVHSFQVELARTGAERARGLMHRTEMAPDHGMLFVFERSGERYFWMKDTPLSLDIIFADENGRIIRIARGTTPFSETIIPSRGEALYVLELLAGTSSKLGINVGDKLVSEAIADVNNP